jgi:beta-lactamase class A
MRRVAALAFLVVGCSSSADEPSSVGESNLTVSSLPETVARLGAEAGQRSPGTQVAIAVRNLTTDEYAAFDDAERHVSASSAKVMWVAAALAKGKNLDDIAGPIFKNSDNAASGTAINRAGGADAVNQFMWNLGMDRSLLANWYGGIRASNQGVMGGDNYFTAGNTTLFLTKLDRGEVLQEPLKSKLLEWMRWAPRQGYGGWMGTLLPDAARASMMHKAGWLPGPEFSEATMNEIGIIQVPNGPRYAVSILTRKGRDYWGKQKAFMEYASCEIYRSVARDEDLDCKSTTFEFDNDPNTPMHEDATAGSPVVDTLRTTHSWFKCWTTGELHAGGNTTWYFTQGDDNGAWGFVPAAALETTSDFDANPSAQGMPKCP